MKKTKVSLNQAWDLIMNIDLLTDPESVTIFDASGRISYLDVHAENDSPPFDQSRFDGFAVGSPVNNRQSFKIVHEKPITAGDSSSFVVSEGEALPIMTGSPIPKGTRLIVPHEACTIQGDNLILQKIPQKRRMILQKGTDFTKDSILLKKGEKINPLHVAFLALDGRSHLEVFNLPLLCVLSLGNELTSIRTKKLKAAMIRNSHPALIHSLIYPRGKVKYKKHVKDDLDAIEKTLIECLQSKAHIVVTTGGMGTGIKDLTRKAVHAVGAIPLFEGADAVPIGTFSCYLYNEKIIFCLPGGMVGVLLLTKLFIVPFLMKMQGAKIPSEIGPFKMAALQGSSEKKLKKNVFSIRGRESRETIRFIKARSWVNEHGEILVTPLDAEALLKINSFIIVNSGSAAAGGKIPIFTLWKE